MLGTKLGTRNTKMRKSSTLEAQWKNKDVTLVTGILEPPNKKQNSLGLNFMRFRKNSNAVL